MTNEIALGLGAFSATLLTAGLLGARLVRARRLARQLASEVQTRDERLRVFVRSCRGYALVLLDADGRIVEWNEGATSVHGWEEAEILGKSAAVFFTPEDVADGRPGQVLRIAAAEGRFAEQGWRVRRDGNRYWADVIVTALRGPDGALTGFADATNDGSDRNRVESELIAMIVREQEALRAAEQAIVARDHFLSVASHELRTPLTSLQLLVQSLLRGARRENRSDDAEQRKLASIDRHVIRFANLIEQLLDVSRITSGKLEIHRERLDLAEVVRDVVARFEADLAKSGCNITVRADDSLVGEWDAFRMEQVVGNLLSNAIKYGGGAPIEIDLEEKNGMACLRVRDHGIGIAPKDQERIFQRFERAVSDLHYGGLGLGLWIVRQTVEAQGGRIAVESDAGKGATFTVELPVFNSSAIHARA